MKYNIPSPEQTAKMFGVTVEMIKKQYADNARGLTEMLYKARNTGKKVNGYTLEELESLVKTYSELSK